MLRHEDLFRRYSTHIISKFINNTQVIKIRETKHGLGSYNSNTIKSNLRIFARRLQKTLFRSFESDIKLRRHRTVY